MSLVLIGFSAMGRRHEKDATSCGYCYSIVHRAETSEITEPGALDGLHELHQALRNGQGFLKGSIRVSIGFL